MSQDREIMQDRKIRTKGPRSRSRIQGKALPTEMKLKVRNVTTAKLNRQGLITAGEYSSSEFQQKLSRSLQRHPWWVLGVCIGVGGLLGFRLGKS